LSYQPASQENNIPVFRNSGLFRLKTSRGFFFLAEKDEGRLACIQQSHLSLSQTAKFSTAHARRKNLCDGKDMAFLFCQEENGRDCVEVFNVMAVCKIYR
jgi:hypothetical protein